MKEASSGNDLLCIPIIVINTMTKNNLGSKGFISFYSFQSTIEGSIRLGTQGRR